MFYVDARGIILSQKRNVPCDKCVFHIIENCFGKKFSKKYKNNNFNILCNQDYATKKNQVLEESV